VAPLAFESGPLPSSRQASDSRGPVRTDQPSFTAAWVAAMRGLGAFLPARLRLADDPYGLRFAGALRALRGGAGSDRRASLGSRLWMRGPLRRFAIYMQIRTRVIDDDVAAFARSGGRQLVLLGAGFDCRAWRLAALEGVRVFEVDHPATQAKKRAVMSSEATAARVVFVPWDFEREPLAELPARLVAEGHDPRLSTMTIVEGVLMYLTSGATDATFECIREYSTPGSPAAITYMNTSLIADRSGAGIGRRLAVRVVGEPFRSGFDPERLPGWLEERGFRLERDESAAQAGGRLLGAEVGRRIHSRRNARSHFALVRRA
jgi:methyltransferase (TIGR00027 family)